MDNKTDKKCLVTDFYQFRLPASIILSGRSGCGKSELMLNIIQNRQTLVNILPDRIIWSYTVDQPEFFSRMPKEVELVQGLPNDLDDLGLGGESTWLILDDQMEELKKETSRIFTAYSHKRKCTAWLILQNFFDNSRWLRNISLNCHIMIIFPNLRDMSQFNRIAGQIFPSKRKQLIKVYEEVSKTPFNYLLIDTTILCPDNLRIRSDILNPKGCIVWTEEI